MRSLFLSVVLLGMSAVSFSQSLEEKLYYTCKVWGFVKYHHSEVSMCKVDWDSVLLHVLPLVRSSTTSAEFNDALDTMLLAAGPMALSSTYLPPITDPELTHNLDWSWTGSPVFRSDVTALLDTITHNFRPHAMCQVDYNYGGSTSSPYGGYLKFPPDTVMVPTNVKSSLPDADHRMMMLFKMWNMIRYFNPYNYVLSTNIDTTLYHMVPKFDNAVNLAAFNLAYHSFTASLDDAHVEGLSYIYGYGQIPGYYTPRLLLRYMEGQYVVVRSLEPGILPGDAILSVDGLTIAQWEDSLFKHYSAGSIEIKRRTVADLLLARQNTGTNVSVTLADSTGASYTRSMITINSYSTAYSSFFGNYYYPADTLSSTEWSIFDCNIGYMNYGNITDGGTDAAYAAMRNLPGIVLDIRNYPISGNAWALADKLLTGPQLVTRLTIPDVTYPGTYTWKDVTMGTYGNPTPYSGKVVIIVDENTQSAAEYTTMMSRAYPNCTVIGGHTAGADGNVTYLQPAYDMRFGWTSLGVFYPNGDSTQRIGIVPDVPASPTREGVRHHRDYVLEQALIIAGCPVGTPALNWPAPVVSLFPNPVEDVVTVDVAGVTSNDVVISISDVMGKVLLTNTERAMGAHVQSEFDVSKLSPGLYIARMVAGDRQSVIKFVKK